LNNLFLILLDLNYLINFLFYKLSFFFGGRGFETEPYIYYSVKLTIKQLINIPKKTIN